MAEIVSTTPKIGMEIHVNDESLAKGSFFWPRAVIAVEDDSNEADSVIFQQGWNLRATIWRGASQLLRQQKH